MKPMQWQFKCLNTFLHLNLYLLLFMCLIWTWSIASFNKNGKVRLKMFLIYFLQNVLVKNGTANTSQYIKVEQKWQGRLAVSAAERFVYTAAEIWKGKMIHADALIWLSISTRFIQHVAVALSSSFILIISFLNPLTVAETLLWVCIVLWLLLSCGAAHKSVRAELK